MTRFALIELNSGFVWWVGDADGAIQACQRSDDDTGNTNRAGEFQPISRGEISSTAGGYAVHLAPAGFDVQDGQDPDAITLTDALPLAGYYRRAAEE